MRIDDYSVAWYAGMVVVESTVQFAFCIYVDFKLLYVNIFRVVYPLCQK